MPTKILIMVIYEEFSGKFPFLDISMVWFFYSEIYMYKLENIILICI